MHGGFEMVMNARSHRERTDPRDGRKNSAGKRRGEDEIHPGTFSLQKERVLVQPMCRDASGLRIRAPLGRQPRVVNNRRAHASHLTSAPRPLEEIVHLSLPYLTHPPCDKEARTLNIDEPHIREITTVKGPRGGGDPPYFTVP